MTTIKIKVHNPKCMPTIIKKGEWIDLASSSDYDLKAPTINAGRYKQQEGLKQKEVSYYPQLIDLGVSMQLPKGYEAIIAPRSSNFKCFGVMQSNSIGVIDNSYSGTNDIWKCQVIPFMNGTINQGERVCQFRIQLSQKATFLQKLKWLFSSGIKFEVVSELNNTDRGGYGTTGTK